MKDKTPGASQPTETDILKEIRIALGSHGVRLFRNNVGQCRTEFGAVIVFGLCPGSSDLIGWSTREITPDMVGKKVAIFTALEVKKPGRSATPEQRTFISVVKTHGGIAAVVKSVEEAKEILNK